MYISGYALTENKFSKCRNLGICGNMFGNELFAT
jgi:hypothetical protein